MGTWEVLMYKHIERLKNLLCHELLCCLGGNL